MDRNQYLTQIWKPYPPMPEKTQVAGRIYEIQRDADSLRLHLLRDSKIHKIHFEMAPVNSEFLQEGDLVAVVSAQEICLLAPQKGPLPRRTFNEPLLRRWQEYLQTLRDFFSMEGFLEIKTPSLVPCPGTEPSLDVFATSLKAGSRREALYLPTSPELHLKKALALGAEKIYEIAPCYRNGEITERHQPEFLMLEWYRAFDNLKTIKSDVEHLIGFIAQRLQVPAPRAVRSYSVAELFQTYCDFQFTPQTTAEELRSLAVRLGVDVHSAESIDDLFFLIFMEKIENKLNPDELIFVEKYPPYQAALARLTPDGWGDRFEVYWQGLELANAFHELNDPVIQRQRSLEDLAKKRELHKDPVALDEEFFQSLEAGLPPSGGIALGVERLFMAFMGISRISELRLFPK